MDASFEERGYVFDPPRIVSSAQDLIAAFNRVLRYGYTLRKISLVSSLETS
jgi:hypothetical protein